MKTHGYINGGELIAFLLMLGGAILALAFAVVAVGVMIADRSSALWWCLTAGSAAVTLGAWLYL